MRIFREPEPAGDQPEQSLAEEISRMRANLAGVKAIIAVGSARGGVGKSALTVNIAALLTLAGRKVGIVDADLNSPSILAMLGMKPPRRISIAEGIEPGAGPLGLRIAASNLLAEGEPAPISFLEGEEAQIPNLNGAHQSELGYFATIRRLLGQTRFGALDVLFVDLGPGIEQIYRLACVLPRLSLLLVSHPSELSTRATKSGLDLADQFSIQVIGVIENMAGFNCDGCHSVRVLMPLGGIANLARERGVQFVERLPFDPRLAESSDRGVLFVRDYQDTPLAKQIGTVAQAIDRQISARQSADTAAI